LGESRALVRASSSCDRPVLSSEKVPHINKPSTA
jgi:hypothetical protein